MKTFLLFFFVAFSAFNSERCLALDLDDGIEIDDSIDVYHELGKFKRNVGFNIMKSMSRSARARAAAKDRREDADSNSSKDKISGNTKILGESSNGLITLYDDGDSLSKTAAVTSIIIGEGSNIKGDIIIIDNSTGDKTAIAK